MSEIKGQLLGIILTLMVFAAVSVTIAAVYRSSANKVSEKANNIEKVQKTFEAELKPELSPLEKSLINDWINHGYTADQIIDAMRECLSKGKKTFKSIDKLLLQWQTRDDIEKTGTSAVSDKWDKNIEESLKIAKAKWIDD